IGRIAVSRLYDDYAVHPIRDMGEDWRCTTVVHEYTWLVGGISEGALFFRHDIDKFLARRCMHGMEIHGVGHIRIEILQCEVKDIALLNSQYRPRHGAVECPSVIEDALGDFHI